MMEAGERPSMKHVRRRALFVAVAVFVCAATAVAALAVAIGSGCINITSTARPPDHYAGIIPAHASPVDHDGDGVDDQEDILRGALSYVATKPRYRSTYYASGYPNDGFGVCTDVVAFALHAAGYDLMALVADDVSATPEAYGIETPDAAIDFRRTANLEVFLARHAAELTCDTSELEEWQGGDIVLYEGHVGIVSDRRTMRGVPYLIHHASPFQLAYEEDALERCGAIVGHFRWTPK